jgi:2-phospho-L-lactate guanylyltransferase
MRFALVPMKPLALAKTRLSKTLGDTERMAISFAMFHDVLDAVIQAQKIERVAVVSGDPALLELSRGKGAIAIDEGAPRGLNAAVALGTEHCLARGASSVLVVLSDLPFATSDDIDSLYRGLPDAPHVRLVRSHEGLGTNALLRLPPRVISTRFGGRSFQDHVSAAADAEVSWSEVQVAGLSLDVDVIEDLQQFATVPRETRTFLETRRIGLAAR